MDQHVQQPHKSSSATPQGLSEVIGGSIDEETTVNNPAHHPTDKNGKYTWVFNKPETRAYQHQDSTIDEQIESSCQPSQEQTSSVTSDEPANGSTHDTTSETSIKVQTGCLHRAKYWIVTVLILVIVGIVCAVGCGGGVSGVYYLSRLNDTSNTTVCLSQPNVLLVLSTFSGIYTSFAVSSYISEDATDSVTIGLVQSIKPNITMYSGNFSLLQPQNRHLYVLPGSFFYVNFSFSGGPVDKDLTVKFREYMGSARPGRVLYSQSVGPSTEIQSVSYTAIQRGQVEFELTNNKKLSGTYAYNFTIMEIQDSSLELSKYRCTLNSSISSCQNTTLYGQNILLGLPMHISNPQCQPVINVSLMGQNWNVLWLGLSVGIPVVVFLLTLASILCYVRCVQNRSAHQDYTPLERIIR